MNQSDVEMTPEVSIQQRVKNELGYGSSCFIDKEDEERLGKMP